MQTYQAYQAPMFSGLHNTHQNHFNNNQAKPFTLFEEDPFHFFADADSHQTGNFSPSEFTSFDNIGASPSHMQSYFDKERFADNFNFTLDFTSFKNEADLFTLEKFEQPKSHCKNVTAGDLINSNQEDFMVQNLLETKQEESHEQSEQSEAAPVTVINSNSGLKGWSEDDEKLLKKLAVQYKFDWKKIAKKFDNKKYTPHFLKMRYKGHVEGPVPLRVKFTHDEDVLIAKYFNEYGVDWEKMVSHFPNRTPVMLKNRYYSHIRKNRKLEDLLKELQDTESNHISHCMSQVGDHQEFSATSTEDHYSQFQTEVMIDISQEKSEVKKPKKDEVAKLKAQLRSLKGLYMNAFKELNKLRGNQI